MRSSLQPMRWWRAPPLLLALLLLCTAGAAAALQQQQQQKQKPKQQKHALQDAAAALAPPPQEQRKRHLTFVSVAGRSHMIPYLEVLSVLAARGHRITVVTERGCEPWIRPNYPLLELRFVPDEFYRVVDDTVAALVTRTLSGRDGGAADGFALILRHVTLPFYRANAEMLLEMLGGSQHDVVLCDFMYDACADVADTLGLRYAVTLSGLPPGVSEAPYTTGWFCPHLEPTSERMSLWQRLQCNVLLPLQVVTSLREPLAKLEALRREVGIRAPTGPPGVRHAHALKIINTFVGFETPRPLHPTVQMIGPIRSGTNSTLPADIAEWIRLLPRSSAAGGAKRLVYVAFGNRVDAPEHLIKGLMAALLSTLDAGLADGVVWALSRLRRELFPPPEQLDARVLLVPFAPQKALLQDNNVALFVSHGGAESSHEAMFAGKPMLVVPFFGDQPMNAAKLRAAGMAELLPYHQFTEQGARELLVRMLDPAAAPAYAAAARRMQALADAHASTNTEAAANMLEFFATHGWDHLVTADTRLPWHKAGNADMWAAVAAAALAALAAAALASRAVAAAASRWLSRGRPQARGEGIGGGGGGVRPSFPRGAKAKTT